MAAQIRDALEAHRPPLVGRHGELTLLLDSAVAQRPLVTHVSGVGGIGKTRLLQTFIAEARAAGATVLYLDGRSVEPTPAGLTAAFAAAAGCAPGLDSVLARLAATPGRVVLILDTYEVLRTLDAWIRQVLLPSLPAEVRVVTAGREPPAPGWLATPEWQGEFRAMQLGLLSRTDALDLLAHLGVRGDRAERVSRLARGHPLALSVAAGLSAGRLDRDIEDLAAGSLEQVAREYLADLEDVTTRETLEAASTVRRTTEPLLGAMLPHLLPRDAADRLAGLPFVESGRDGLIIHDAVREAVAASLRMTAPERYRQYRIAAWRMLQGELNARRSDANAWRMTADLFYLMEHPAVRENFFPTGAQPVTIEPARPEDERDYRAILEAHDGPEAVRALLAWWEFAPSSVKMVRGREGETVGFSVFAPADELDRRVATRDPIVARWFDHQRTLGSPSRAIFVRRFLDRDAGEEASLTTGAFMLDLKRTYVELRPALRYVYVTARDPHPEMLRHLLWEPLPGSISTLDGDVYQEEWLDMGPGSVEDWLSRIIASELGVDAASGRPTLDEAARELVLGDTRIPLTELEARLVGVLLAHPDRAVTRADLIEHVWRYEGAATSNVIEATVRGLRRKLGEHAPLVETVRGVGYRYRPPALVGRAG